MRATLSAVLAVALSAGGLVGLSPSAGAGEGAARAAAQHLEAKAACVVQVKVVLRLGDQENNFTYQGTIVDASGVILTANFAAGFRGVKSTPVSIRVVFPGDEKEHDAILGAFDSKLGLAFVRLKDLGDRKLEVADVAGGADPSLGEELFGVMRMDEGFDYAPYFGVTTVVGHVQKPRTMWVPQGFLPLACPLYHLDGRVAGIVIRQEGIAEGGGLSRFFLLPVDAAKAVVAQAVRASEKALQDAKAAADATPAPEGGAAAAPEAGMAGEAPAK